MDLRRGGRKSTTEEDNVECAEGRNKLTSLTMPSNLEGKASSQGDGNEDRARKLVD